MTTYFGIVCVLAVVDALIVAACLLFLRPRTVADRRNRLGVGIAVAAFVPHALLFFSGAFLYLQLATLAGIYMSLTLWPPAPQPAGGDRSPSSDG